MWPEDLPAGSVVMLSGKDDLMDSAQVKATLEAAGHVKVRVRHAQPCGHADACSHAGGISRRALGVRACLHESRAVCCTPGRVCVLVR